MKRVLAACLALSSVAFSGNALAQCESADPTGVLASLGGDFELVVDPQDAEANLIIVGNRATGASQIAAARVNGVTGQVAPQTLTIIAENFLGAGRVNGPEFLQKPSGELGVLFAGPGGVHAVFRNMIPNSWNELIYDVYGALSTSSPPPLSSTTGPGAYPSF